jgi:hypothetical protein
MTSAHAFEMPAEQGPAAARAAAEGNVVYLTERGERLAAVVPIAAGDAAFVAAAATHTCSRLAHFEAAAAQAGPVDADEATAAMLARGDGPPDAQTFARVLRAEGGPVGKITEEATRLAEQAAALVRRSA